MRAGLLLGMALLLGGGVIGIAALAPGCQGERDPFLDALEEVTTRYGREDDAIHRLAVPPTEKARLWSDVRKRRAAEVREVYERFGRKPPGIR